MRQPDISLEQAAT